MSAAGKARTFSVASSTGVSADGGTLARPDAGTDARTDARPRGVLPAGEGRNSHDGRPLALSPVQEYDRKRDARAVTAAVLALARTYERVAEKAAELRTEIDRAATLLPREVQAILLINGLSPDLTPLGDD